MSNPSGGGGGGGGRRYSATFSNSDAGLISSFLFFLKKPQAFPFLLSIFVLLTWLSLRFHHSPSSSFRSSQSQHWPHDSDKFAHLVRFSSSSFPSLIFTDPRGWLLNPALILQQTHISEGPFSCTSVHVGEIRPGGVRGNHRHHTCNETLVFWGAQTKFRLESNHLAGRNYAESTIGPEEVAVSVSMAGTAHALINVDSTRTTFFLGCQDNVGCGNQSSTDYKKLATLVGCNYFSSPHELHGCINDVQAMRHLLVSHFGFDPANIDILTDDAPEDSPVRPTGANIRAVLGRMVERAKPGDVLLFHYSGHGTRLPVGRPSLHPFRMDEAIVPCDLNLITDVDFRRLVDRIPRGATFTIISDSCHSGGLINREKEQIGPDTVYGICGEPTKSGRGIPYEIILDQLSSISGVSSPHMGDHLLHVFGPDASLKYRGPEWEKNTNVEWDEGILLSGCQANETSADMDPQFGGGKAYGAFSNALQMVLREQRDDREEMVMSNGEVVKRARDILKAQGFKQHPCLYSSDENAHAPFLNSHQLK